MSAKYLIWNNKGGVGKTFLTFTLATEYARTNPDKDVVVIDACPQSNVSEMLLGGNGAGEKKLSELRSNDTTIAGYIKERYSKSKSEKLGNEGSYFKKLSDYNSKMPDNIFLLPGDVDLDICSSLIDHLSSAPIKGAWMRSRLLLNDLIESFELNKDSNKQKVFLIDCNPSFSNYTEMAVLASNRVIIPCTADAASLRGMTNLFKLIYGVLINKENRIDEDLYFGFNAHLETNNLTRPLIHSFILNRSRSHLKEPSHAFKAHLDELNKVMDDIKKVNPTLFLDSSNTMFNVKDGNTLASILNHEGQPLSQLKSGEYFIYGEKTNANSSQIEPLLDDLKKIVATL